LDPGGTELQHKRDSITMVPVRGWGRGSPVIGVSTSSEPTVGVLFCVYASPEARGAGVLLSRSLSHGRVLDPIRSNSALNPGPHPSPGELTLHGPQVSSGPGLGTTPQSTGILFPVLFMRSLRLEPHWTAPRPPTPLTPQQAVQGVRAHPPTLAWPLMGECKPASLTLHWLPQAGETLLVAGETSLLLQWWLSWSQTCSSLGKDEGSFCLPGTKLSEAPVL
jgi:hypothetical protein